MSKLPGNSCPIQCLQSGSCDCGPVLSTGQEDKAMQVCPWFVSNRHEHCLCQEKSSARGTTMVVVDPACQQHGFQLKGLKDSTEGDGAACENKE